jgi:hypothetical protein
VAWIGISAVLRRKDIVSCNMASVTWGFDLILEGAGRLALSRCGGFLIGSASVGGDALIGHGTIGGS